MESTIKSIVDAFFKEKKLDVIEEMENILTKKFGRAFIDKNILQLTVEKKTVKIKTNTIEGKSEINLHKKEIKIKGHEIKIL